MFICILPGKKSKMTWQRSPSRNYGGEVLAPGKASEERTRFCSSKFKHFSPGWAINDSSGVFHGTRIVLDNSWTGKGNEHLRLVGKFTSPRKLSKKQPRCWGSHYIDIFFFAVSVLLWAGWSQEQGRLGLNIRHRISAKISNMFFLWYARMVDWKQRVPAEKLMLK